MASCVLDPETVRFGRLLHYAGVAIALLCAAAAYSCLFTPIEQDIFNVSVRIDELTESSRNAPAIRSEHEKLSGRLKDIQARYAALQGRVPGSAESGSFLKYVSDIARQENLAISDFQPAKSVRRRRLHGDGSHPQRPRQLRQHLFVFRSALQSHAALESERRIGHRRRRRHRISLEGDPGHLLRPHRQARGQGQGGRPWISKSSRRKPIGVTPAKLIDWRAECRALGRLSISIWLIAGACSGCERRRSSSAAAAPRPRSHTALHKPAEREQANRDNADAAPRPRLRAAGKRPTSPRPSSTIHSRCRLLFHNLQKPGDNKDAQETVKTETPGPRPPGLKRLKQLGGIRSAPAPRCPRRHAKTGQICRLDRRKHDSRGRQHRWIHRRCDRRQWDSRRARFETMSRVIRQLEMHNERATRRYTLAAARRSCCAPRVSLAYCFRPPWQPLKIRKCTICSTASAEVRRRPRCSPKTAIPFQPTTKQNNCKRRHGRPPVCSNRGN